MNNTIFYRLDENGEGHPATDLDDWVAWRSTVDPKVGYDVVGETLVSTIFLGVNLEPRSEPPVLFETALVTPTGTTVIGRYATLPEAKAGHLKAMHRVIAPPKAEPR